MSNLIGSNCKIVELILLEDPNIKCTNFVRELESAVTGNSNETYWSNLRLHQADIYAFDFKEYATIKTFLELMAIHIVRNHRFCNSLKLQIVRNIRFQIF